jgi:hypothetical protein
VREQAVPAQIAPHWLMVQGPWIVPISGTSVANIDEGCGQSGKVGLRQVIRVIAEPAIRKLHHRLREQRGSPCHPSRFP